MNVREEKLLKCPDCDGTGSMSVQITDEDFENIECKRCSGAGWIPVMFRECDGCGQLTIEDEQSSCITAHIEPNDYGHSHAEYTCAEDYFYCKECLSDGFCKKCQKVYSKEERELMKKEGQNKHF